MSLVIINSTFYDDHDDDAMLQNEDKENDHA